MIGYTVTNATVEDVRSILNMVGEEWVIDIMGLSSFTIKLDYEINTVKIADR